MFKLASRGARFVVGGLQKSPIARTAVTGARRNISASRTYYPLGRSHHHPLGSGILNQKCNCSYRSNAVHTKGDKELAEFLAGEISAEQKAQPSPKLTNIEGFDVVTDGAALTFTKKSANQSIKVFVNVNHTVDADIPDEEVTDSQDKVNLSEMQSKPAFRVEVEQDGRTLSFGCTFVTEQIGPEEQADPDTYNDVFNIEEVSMYEGKREETTYAVSGEIMDGYLYDLLMNFLEERGISNEFAEKLVEYCTSYEHKLYIGLLEKIKAFASK